jgi:hypothetical protein
MTDQWSLCPLPNQLKLLRHEIEVQARTVLEFQETRHIVHFSFHAHEWRSKRDHFKLRANFVRVVNVANAVYGFQARAFRCLIVRLNGCGVLGDETASSGFIKGQFSAIHINTLSNSGSRVNVYLCFFTILCGDTRQGIQKTPPVTRRATFFSLVALHNLPFVEGLVQKIITRTITEAMKIVVISVS